jgi:hypothetical protein
MFGSVFVVVVQGSHCSGSMRPMQASSIARIKGELVEALGARASRSLPADIGSLTNRR